MVVRFDQLTKSEDGAFVTEASTIGLSPGQWPIALTVMRDGEVFGVFRRTHRCFEGVVVYLAHPQFDPTAKERELHVLND